jgi:hypothetical protein
MRVDMTDLVPQKVTDASKVNITVLLLLCGGVKVEFL